jgi:hypothetical protein
VGPAGNQPAVNPPAVNQVASRRSLRLQHLPPSHGPLPNPTRRRAPAAGNANNPVLNPVNPPIIVPGPGAVNNPAIGAQNPGLMAALLAGLPGIAQPVAPIPTGLTPAQLATHQAASNHNHHHPISHLHRLPPPLRNIIYQLCLDNWTAAHRANNELRQRYGTLPPGVAWPHPQITAARHPLILTPHNGFNPGAGPWPNIQAAHVTYRNYYDQMKRDLLALGQVSQQFRVEFRSFQAANITSFVRVECLNWFMNVFFPYWNTPNDPRSSQYGGIPPIVTLPWLTSATWDFLSLIEFTRRNRGALSAPGTPVIWARDRTVTNPPITHSEQLTQLLFSAGVNSSLLEYIDTGMGYSFAQVLVRSHGHLQPGGYNAVVEIWFANGQNLTWVDGQAWHWPAPIVNGPWPTLALPTSDVIQRRWEIRTFVETAGLQHDEIRQSWGIDLGILGVHPAGGQNI